jgi:hypothetical protein
MIKVILIENYRAKDILRPIIFSPNKSEHSFAFKISSSLKYGENLQIIYVIMVSPES